MTYFNEKEAVKDKSFVLGEYIYMGMGKYGKQSVCISVGYKIDYCYKKAMEFENLDDSINFYKINKVKIGELKPCDFLLITKEMKDAYEDERI